MIVQIPDFATKKELFEYLVKNKELLITQKKMGYKESDGFVVTELPQFSQKSVDLSTKKDIQATVIINTTNWMDSHKDVHLPGIWGKSVSENRNIKFLQEHKMQFDSIIADGKDLNAYVRTFTWKELGYNYNGKTEALTFDATIRKVRNEFMFSQYAKGYVNNHSVGMQYIRIALAINDKAYGSEYEVWQKYFPEIVNYDLAEETGYFWAVPEARAIEGSAVPIGSNSMTPVLNMKSAPPTGTRIYSPPSYDTVKNIIHEQFKTIKL